MPQFEYDSAKNQCIDVSKLYQYCYAVDSNRVSCTSCINDNAYIKYIILNRNICILKNSNC